MGSRYYLAIDIGASSGRHILSHLENGRMVLEEVYRFQNGMIEKNGHKVWDIDRLFTEVKNGIKKCKALGRIPYSLGIDTWAVDFVLLGQNGQRLTDAVAYRDERTSGMDKKVYEIISERKLYKRTGIQKQIFNTIYQLMYLKENEPECLAEAESMLMIPDYLSFLLTGEKVQEYTNATTTQLVNPDTKNWDDELIELLGFPRKIFKEIKTPGYQVGMLKDEIQKEVGFSCRVVLPATHDTASAVLAVPAKGENNIYISSGTWSLMGTELKEPYCSEDVRRKNFTNEGGYDYRYRFLKNIMGLWMIQSVRKELAPQMSFGEICEGASHEKIKSIVDANDDCFLAPESMSAEIRLACRRTDQEVPETLFQTAAVIYNSLAACYAKTMHELENRWRISDTVLSAGRRCHILRHNSGYGWTL